MKEIRRILEVYDNTDHQSEKLALASVVGVEESSYRRIGARMLVSSNGQWTGGISGGCLEGDALRRSQQAIFKNQSSTVVYDTLDDEDNALGIGLGCNGKIEVMFTPIDPNDKENQIEQLRQAVQKSEPTILLKVIENEGNKKHIGKSLLIDADLNHLDFLNFSSATIMTAIQETRIKRRPQLIDIENESKDRYKILVEYIRPETKLVIIGDNYDVIAFVGIAEELGWEIHVVGRKKKMAKAIFEKSKKVYEYEEYDQISINEFTAVVLMSHDFTHDKKLLPLILKQNLPYVGMLGPKKRMIKMQSDLNIDNLDNLNFFYSPVGLDIGAESPEEIALSIAAEIVSVFRKRDGTPLKFRKGAIHDRY
ncbi:MAG: XdhC family protein [Saprospiraceae bacterium]|nr:XdhC family protein [Bacteroidia bacterium]NNE14573.1 XdhC family protein [Saprospiraceae bacterium]